MASIPPDYLERVYAGVLGKLIGVYLGRPFEGWTHQQITNKLGHIQYYVHEKLDVPLLVTDDDVSGTFIFPRALLEHGISTDITSEAIGKTWLNNVVEKRSIFWWGGNGVSTEHTAYLNLKKGIKAPQSGSIATNGKTVAEQIGAQIFIDGWGMIVPGQPALAARLAEKAGKVSHDGESVYAAMHLAAMEAEAFDSKDVNHLLDTGLSFIPKDCLIATLIGEVREWATTDKDWLQTRQRIEDKYGYDKFCGNCHIIPNHGIMTLALLYGGHDFHEAMHIINTCGWDTDCNSGNIACLVAIMHGLTAFENGPDWRGPLADQALISSADAGYSINNAARITYDLVDMGRQIAGLKPLDPPKDGAQFHFTLPGSVQGFKVTPNSLLPDLARIAQTYDQTTQTAGLAIHLRHLTPATGPIEVLSATFTPPEITKMGKTYDLQASPLIYPGQTVQAVIQPLPTLTAPIEIRFRLRTYNAQDTLSTFDSPEFLTIHPSPTPSQSQTLQWTIPDTYDHQPIQQLGLSLSSTSHVNGSILLSSLSWTGTPNLTIRRPTAAPTFPIKQSCDFWRQAWINSVSNFHGKFGPSYYLAQDSGEGIVLYGTREWRDYSAVWRKFRVNLGRSAGVVVRNQGLRRWYALLLLSGSEEGRGNNGGGGKEIAFVRAWDEERTVLARAEFEWRLDVEYEVRVDVKGDEMMGWVDGKAVLRARDGKWMDGGIGMVLSDGSVSVDEVQVGKCGTLGMKSEGTNGVNGAVSGAELEAEKAVGV